MLLTGRYGIYQ